MKVFKGTLEENIDIPSISQQIQLNLDTGVIDNDLTSANRTDIKKLDLSLEDINNNIYQATAIVEISDAIDEEIAFSNSKPQLLDALINMNINEVEMKLQPKMLPSSLQIFLGIGTLLSKMV